MCMLNFTQPSKGKDLFRCFHFKNDKTKGKLHYFNCFHFMSKSLYVSRLIYAADRDDIFTNLIASSRMDHCFLANNYMLLLLYMLTIIQCKYLFCIYRHIVQVVN